MDDGTLHQFVCSRCGAHDSVKFKPRSGALLLCSSCFRAENRNEKARRPKPPVPRTKQLYPIVCAHCGAHDHVNFQPRPESKVLCSVCNANPEIVERVKRTRHQIICDRCGTQAHVPFVPDPGSKVYCRSCLHKIKQLKESQYSVRRTQGWVPPGVQHKTRVRFEIECSECGCEDSLPFVPKTPGPLLCRRCAEKRLGPEWQGSREPEKPIEHSITCARCGHRDFVPFEPKPDRAYYCDRCRQNQAVAKPERLSGRQPHQENVYIKKKED